jgi:hypothetical protein
VSLQPLGECLRRFGALELLPTPPCANLKTISELRLSFLSSSDVVGAALALISTAKVVYGGCSCNDDPPPCAEGGVSPLGDDSDSDADDPFASLFDAPLSAGGGCLFTGGAVPPVEEAEFVALIAALGATLSALFISVTDPFFNF